MEINCRWNDQIERVPNNARIYEDCMPNMDAMHKIMNHF